MRSKLVRRIVVGVVLVAACALCFGRLVIHPADTLVGPQRGGANDLTDYFQPLRVYQLQTWRRYGQLPAWDYHLQLGRPTTGNPQASLYYPPNWLYFLLGSPRIASWLMVLHHLFAGWGMYLLCRRYKFVWQAALLGGVAYLAAPYFVAHTAEGHYPQICVAAWIPWALVCFERLRLGKRFSVPLMALVLALAFFCGHAQEVYYLVLVLTGFWTVDLIRQPPGVLPRGDFAVRWIGVGLLTASLVAVELLPIWYTSKQTTRGQAAVSSVHSGARPENLLQLANPYALGSPAEMLPHNKLYWETLLSFGIVPLLLAVAGVALGWRRYPVPRYAVLLLAALLFALGDSTPFYPLLHNFVPGMSTFRVPSRIMFIASAATAVLAAGGTHQLMQWAQRSAAMGKAAAWGALLLAAVAAVELAMHGMTVTRTLAAGGLRQESELTARFADSAAEYRVWIDQDLLSDEEAWRHNIAKVRGYDPFLLIRYGAVLKASLGGREVLSQEAPGYATDENMRYSPGVMSLMGVRYLAVRQSNGFSDVDSTRASDPPGWQLVERGSTGPRVRLRGATGKEAAYLLYENESALPRAFVLGHAAPAAGGARVIGQLEQIDPRKQLLVNKDTLPAGDRQDFAPAKMVEYAPTKVVVDAELALPGYLVLTDMFAPGWKATVDGRPAPMVPVNIGFRGVPLTPGEHRVEFTFTPPLWKLSALISCLSLLICLSLVVKTKLTKVEPRRHGDTEELRRTKDK